MTPTDDMMKAASLVARKLKDALDVETLPAITESTQEMEKGSPVTPGYQADYGQGMKPAPLWPQARDVVTHERAEPSADRDANDHDIDR